MTNTLQFTKKLALIIGNITGVSTYCELDIDSVEGEFSQALILTLSTNQEVVQGNNTQRLHYNLGFVVQPETCSSDEQASKLNVIYEMLVEYLQSLVKYGDVADAIYLDHEIGQWSIDYDKQQTTFILQFQIVMQF